MPLTPPPDRLNIGIHYEAPDVQPDPLVGTLVVTSPTSNVPPTVLAQAVYGSVCRGYSLCVLDGHYPGLSLVAMDAYHARLTACPADDTVSLAIIDLDDVTKSARCNPLASHLIDCPAEAYAAAELLVLNLNRTYVAKRTTPLVERSIQYVAGAIWYLKQYTDTQAELTNPKSAHKLVEYCSFPHLLEFIRLGAPTIMPLMLSHPGVARLLPGGGVTEVQEAFEGIGIVTRLVLERYSRPSVYWVMSGDELDIEISADDGQQLVCIGRSFEDVSTGCPLQALIFGQINRRTRLASGPRRPTSFMVDSLEHYFLPRNWMHARSAAHPNKMASWAVITEPTTFNHIYGEVPTVTGGLEKNILPSSNMLIGQLDHYPVALQIDVAAFASLTGQTITLSDLESLDENEFILKYQQRGLAPDSGQRLTTGRVEGLPVHLMRRDDGECLPDHPPFLAELESWHSKRINQSFFQKLVHRLVGKKSDPSPPEPEQRAIRIEAMLAQRVEEIKADVTRMVK